jgi:fatty acid desaturase
VAARKPGLAEISLQIRRAQSICCALAIALRVKNGENPPMSLAASARQVQKAGPYLSYRYSLLSPTRIRELSTLKPWRALRDVVACWVCIAAAFAMIVIHPAWWTVLIAIPVIGNRYYGLFIIAHDGMHRRLFPNIKRNDFWTDFLVLAPIGAITRINNRNHLLHHRYLSTPEDPDRHKHACFNKAEHMDLLGYLSGLLSVWASAKAVFVTRGKNSQRYTTQANSASDGYTFRDFALLGGWFAALAGALTWLVGWWAYPVLWLFPVYSFMFLGDNLRSFAEHSHPEGDNAADHHRLITYTSNPIERMFVAPMNMNFHAAHHLWPSIPYYNLPIADREIRHRPESKGIEWRDSYFRYVFAYWFALPIEDCKQGR